MARNDDHPLAVVLAHPTLNASRKSTYSASGNLEGLAIRVDAPDEWLNSNDRRHRMPESKIVKKWREAALEVATNLRSIPTPVRVIATVWKSRAGRYDPGNLYPTAKACVDGFTDAGLWPDDDYRHVIGPDMRHGGKGEPGLVFTFESVES